MKLEVLLWTIVLALLALAFLFPKTRWLSLSALLVAVIAIVSLVFIAKRVTPTSPGATPPPRVPPTSVDFEQYLVEKSDKADPEAKNRIPLGDIRFDQIRTQPGAERGSIGAVDARLYNDSKAFTLTDYGYYLVVQDCIRAVCTTVFEQKGLSALTVPPTQARDVTIAFQIDSTRTPPIKILGTANILLTSTATRAAPANTASPTGQ